MAKARTIDGSWEGIRETGLAVLVLSDTGEEKWIPKSVIDDNSEVYGHGTDGVLIVAEWWAEKEGLE